MATTALKLDEATTLTTVDLCKEAIGQAALQTKDHAWLTRTIVAVNQLFEDVIAHRHFRSRAWVHDGDIAGGNLPRLNGSGSRDLFLPNPPITAVSVLKRRYDETALTEGPDGEFTLDNDTGRIRLLYGTFSSEQAVVEVTYTGGYLNREDAGANQGKWVWENQGIQELATETVADLWQRRKAGGLRWQSLSAEAGTFSIDASMLLKHVRAGIEAKRIRSVWLG